MKGIILAGGSGTRLYPLTRVMSKQLLPVYDKPMIYYPLSSLMLFGIRDILIISTPQDTPNMQSLFRDGAKFGLNISYAIQEEPKGIAQAFMIGADFIGNDDVALILGDNIFYFGDQLGNFEKEVKNNLGKRATIFAYRVPNPEQFGVVEFDSNFRAVSIEEKPKNPKSNYVSVGLYFYPSDVVVKSQTLKPSGRGEFEITDINNMYINENRISVMPMPRGNAWLDAGTPKSLMEASFFIQVIEDRLKVKLACIEEIAFKQRFINTEQLRALIGDFKNPCAYKSYLQAILDAPHEVY